MVELHAAWSSKTIVCIKAQILVSEYVLGQQQWHVWVAASLLTETLLGSFPNLPFFLCLTCYPNKFSSLNFCLRIKACCISIKLCSLVPSAPFTLYLTRKSVKVSSRRGVIFWRVMLLIFLLNDRANSLTLEL